MHPSDPLAGADALVLEAQRASADHGLRAELRRRLGRLGKWDSIETGITEIGVPDVHVMLRASREVWIECKHTTGNAVRFKPGQVGWLFTHWRYGGTAFIFTHRQTEWKREPNVDELYITDARYVRELARDGLAKVQHVAVFNGGPSRWNWPQIEEILHGRPLSEPPAPPRDVKVRQVYRPRVPRG